MRADWTKRDANITRFLKSHNIIGVPAYFVKTKSGEVISLGETISINEIKKALTQ
jgi:thiol:disulfide interchange protein